MSIVKSKRHSKYIGQFGEAMVCNMLSRSGFEVMLVDHVGIDVVASKPGNPRMKPIGISVKSRTRHNKTNELSSVNLFSSEDVNLEDACKDFNLEPWIAVYVETEAGADLYLTSFQNYKDNYAGNGSLVTLNWKMRGKHKERYSLDKQVMHLRVDFSQNNWFA